MMKNNAMTGSISKADDMSLNINSESEKGSIIFSDEEDVISKGAKP